MWNLPGKFTQFGDKPGRSFCDSECLGCPRCGCKGRGREGNLQSLPGAVDPGEIPLLELGAACPFQQDHTPAPSQGSREGGDAENSITSGSAFPWNGKYLSGRKESLAGVSARAEEGRESRLGSPEQEKPRSWGGTCTPVCSSWIWGREGKLGITNGSGRGAGLCDKRGEMSPSVCLALLSPLPLACAAVRVPLTH